MNILGLTWKYCTMSSRLLEYFLELRNSAARSFSCLAFMVVGDISVSTTHFLFGASWMTMMMMICYRQAGQTGRNSFRPLQGNASG